MASGDQQLKKRIKSTLNTAQVTKAMEAVSASKMRKAVEKTTASRPYAKRGLEMVQHLQQTPERPDHPLLATRPPKRVLAIVFTSDRGLCGGLNTILLRAFIQHRHGLSEDTMVEIVTVGKKGEQRLKKSPDPLLATFHDLGKEPSVLGIRPITRLVIEKFSNAETDQVLLVYNDFHSALLQEPTIRQLLPISTATIVTQEKDEDASRDMDTSFDYIFEPSPQAVLNALLPRLVENQMYQCLLEATASEHAARRSAMKSATDNANELVDELRLTYNQARQAAITQEIAEISAGRAALEQ